jgi:predicted GIY-YIG superfamily endonuclease
MWHVYILRCADNSLYTGETQNLLNRVAAHNGGKCAFTAARHPVRLVSSETVANRDLALKREQQIKRWTHAKKEALIAGDMAALKRL